jgi:hypothetical protein
VGLDEVLAIVSIWLLLNVLFVLIVVPPRGSRSRLNRSGTILAPAPIEKHQDQLDHNEQFSVRHALGSLATGVFFVLMPRLIVLRKAIVRLWNKSRGRHKT